MFDLGRSSGVPFGLLLTFSDNIYDIFKVKKKTPHNNMLEPHRIIYSLLTSHTLAEFHRVLVANNSNVVFDPHATEIS